MSARRLIATALSTAALAAGSAVVAAPAQAAGPTHTVEDVDFTIPAHPYYSEVCGFPVDLHVWGSYNVVTWTDDEGHVTREIRNYRFRSTSTANGITVHGATRGPEHWTFADDGTAEMRRVGVTNRLVPGAGTVTIFAGYEVVLIDGDTEVVATSVGQREDVELMCSAFA
ncbi:hypothetical protein GCM10023168_11840 [Fodinibacter luteus]|uniref:Uncharacterized protein n=1 Tax=Fodinibacter luteus TaxID=552064 RepID=A0ABP8K815_9MICO